MRSHARGGASHVPGGLAGAAPSTDASREAAVTRRRGRRACRRTRAGAVRRSRRARGSRRSPVVASCGDTMELGHARFGRAVHYGTEQPGHAALTLACARSTRDFASAQRPSWSPTSSQTRAADLAIDESARHDVVHASVPPPGASAARAPVRDGAPRAAADASAFRSSASARASASSSALTSPPAARPLAGAWASAAGAAGGGGGSAGAAVAAGAPLGAAAPAGAAAGALLAAGSCAQPQMQTATASKDHRDERDTIASP